MKTVRLTIRSDKDGHADKKPTIYIPKESWLNKEITSRKYKTRYMLTMDIPKHGLFGIYWYVSDYTGKTLRAESWAESWPLPTIPSELGFIDLPVESVTLITIPDEPATWFDNVRDWATKRGLYQKGDVKTQFVKLQEESGELARGIIKQDNEMIKDSIGDMVVVLTNLAHLADMRIEGCMEAAWQEIKDRKGGMKNGSFVKD